MGLLLPICFAETWGKNSLTTVTVYKCRISTLRLPEPQRRITKRLHILQNTLIINYPKIIAH